RSGGECRRSCARRSRAPPADDTRARLGDRRGGRRGAVTVTSFVTARTVEEALDAMSSGARAVAGGTDLVIGGRRGKAGLPTSRVGRDQLDELRGIAAQGGVLRIGALTSHEAIAADQLIRERAAALADASAIVGSHATRAWGALGGNVMNSS